MAEMNIDELSVPKDISPISLYPASSARRAVTPMVSLSASRSLSDWKQEPGSCLVIVNDGTRPTPTAEIIASDKEFFISENVSYIVATGAHRGPADSEWRQIFGEAYPVIKERIHVHDARDKDCLRFFGTTSFGTEVYFNRLIDSFDRLLIIGSVEPHYFAGFTGGRKGLLPGVAGYETITANHKLALDSQAGLMKLESNPVHEDMLEAAVLIGEKPVYSIMAVLDNEHGLYSLHTGGLDASFLSAVEDAKKVFSVQVPEPADIIITYAAEPMNRELYQSQKAVENVRAALKPGGTIILVSECAEGIGERNFYDLLTAGSSPADVFLRIKEDYLLGYHKAAKLAQLFESSNLFAVTSLAPQLLEAAFIRPFNSLQEAFDKAEADCRKRLGAAPSVLIVPDGSVTSVSVSPA